MEIIAIIFLLWLIGCAFPGSSGGHTDVAGAFASLLAGIIGFAILFAYWGYSLAGILWLGEHFDWNKDITLMLALLGPIAGPMLIASMIKAILERRAAGHEGEVK